MDTQMLIGSKFEKGTEAEEPILALPVRQAVAEWLAEIREALATLPDGRTPTAADWKRLSSRWRSDLDDRIDRLTRLRDQLDGCIGCGCLSLGVCPLWNPWDKLAAQGSGPRILDPGIGVSSESPKGSRNLGKT